MVMKRIYTLFLTLLLASSAFAQTAEQMQALKNLTPAQIEQLKKAQNPNRIELKATQDKKPQVREEIVIDESINKTIVDSTKPERINLVYGHDIFSRQNLTFAPSMNLPTPSSYVLGSGDELNINIWGAAESDYTVVVSPDGYVNIGGVGLVQVGGMTIREADKKIKNQLIRKYEGATEGDVNINISLGKIRTITVNVAGEAKVPGTYSLPSLATLFNALYVAGGVSDIGSVREINLFRAGKKINTLDVYDYLINGDIKVNVRLEDNDLIVVEPYINIVKLRGAVKRPMKYELKSNETLEKLIKYAGGFNGEAYSSSISVSRSADGKQLQMFTVDKPGFGYFVMRDNDSTFVNKVVQKYQNRISISGEVWQTGSFELKQGISTVKELVEQAGGVTPYAFTGRAILYRLNNDGEREVTAVNLGNLLKGIGQDISLRPNDSLAVYSQDFFNQTKNVVVKGEVNIPDTLVYGAGMTLRDAIVACGGLKLSASEANIEVSRRVTDPKAVQTPDNVAEIFTFKANRDLSLNEGSEQFELMPFDEIFIRRSPGYVPQMNVTVEGEVVFDGQYTLKNRVTRLADIIQRAGGLTKDAYAKGAYLRRQKTEFDVDREMSLEKLQQNSMNADTLILTKEGVGSYYSVAINLVDAIADEKSTANIELKDGDRIVVPIFNNTVKISGAVYFPNTVGYREDMSVRNYIVSAGGYSDRARKRPFVIYPNGMVAKRGRVVEPGSEIVIPFKPQKEPMGANGWISLSSSIVSMAAMVTSLFR